MEHLVFNDDYVKPGYWNNENLTSYLERAVRECPDQTAVIDSYSRLTFRELYEQVTRFAGSLRAHGVGLGDVVSFQMPNWCESVVIHQAAAMIGAISNPIIPIYRKKEVRYILTESQTKVLVIPAVFRNFNYLEQTREIAEECPVLQRIVVIDKFEQRPELVGDREVAFSEFMKAGTPHPVVQPVGKADPALLLYTSGTTANPKGVIHTHNTLIHENKTMIRRYELGRDDVVFMPSPVTHITGLLYGLELPFMIQGKVVLQDIWDPIQAIKFLTEEQCTWSVGATLFLRDIVQGLSESDRTKIRLKAFCCGGADVPPSLITHAASELGCYVTRVYGSSEYPTLTACGYDDPLEKAAHTDGRMFEGSFAKILNPNGTEAKTGEVGELAVKGPEMFLGYLQSELNPDSFTDDGFFLTGDLAVFDSDGYLEIKGRKKDIIIRGGENISVKEVEDLLFQHPSIASVAVVAVPDDKMGEKACACVVPQADATLSLSDVRRFLVDQGIAMQKIPEYLEILQEMPMTPSGKIKKFVLRDAMQAKFKQ
ncbi:AMP-binding protein [Alicyclobacillus tolerans]|uniref:AMP-binding protein n=1 Tax=Alicyclobacillus tolerans TaxID=90970 RepID=UPI001F1C3891|nr:AMP-binding protein [Alicyclobacillus tolerans]MCF8565040.1 AMP-binding protein [Alicyclobacillus tolerans]